MDTGIIKKYLEKSAVMERYQSAIKKEEKPKKIDILLKKVEKTNKKLSKINDTQSVRKVLYDYPNTFLAKLCLKNKMKFRNKYKLKITPASEPSQIIYDNMKYNKCNVFAPNVYIHFVVCGQFAVVQYEFGGCDLSKISLTKCCCSGRTVPSVGRPIDRIIGGRK
ncbi:MAG: hypothetical protein GY928_31255 [Colwellia sp.]|nr:hypothetical protein [Colwellia sp.]